MTLKTDIRVNIMVWDHLSRLTPLGPYVRALSSCSAWWRLVWRRSRFWPVVSELADIRGSILTCGTCQLKVKETAPFEPARRTRLSRSSRRNDQKQVESDLGTGKTISKAVKPIGVSEQTCYRWKAKYGQMEKQDVKRLKELERENMQLKKLLAERVLDNEILKEALQGTAITIAD